MTQIDVMMDAIWLRAPICALRLELSFSTQISYAGQVTHRLRVMAPKTGTAPGATLSALTMLDAPSATNSRLGEMA